MNEEKEKEPEQVEIIESDNHSNEIPKEEEVEEHEIPLSTNESLDDEIGNQPVLDHIEETSSLKTEDISLQEEIIDFTETEQTKQDSEVQKTDNEIEDEIITKKSEQSSDSKGTISTYYFLLYFFLIISF